MVFGDEAEFSPNAKIKVIGCGGAGCNFIDRMICYDVRGVEFVAVNTDSQCLKKNRADLRVQIGKVLTTGYGAGGNPQVGREAALESEEDLRSVVSDADMVFVTTGMGGGTGTGSAPVIARIAREAGCLTVGIVTKPFTREGNKRMEYAEAGIEELKKYVDTLIVIPNQKIYSIIDPSTPLLTAYREIDDVIRQAVQGVADIINMDGLINVDLADVKSVMKDKGTALMGIGVASGPDRAVQAARNAIHSKLLEHSIDGANQAIVNITASDNITAYEAEAVLAEIRNNCSGNIDIKPGQTISRVAGDELIVTVIATGYELKQKDTEMDKVRDTIYSENESIEHESLTPTAPSVNDILDSTEKDDEEDTSHLFHEKKHRSIFGFGRHKEEKKETPKKEEIKEEDKSDSKLPSWLD